MSTAPAIAPVESAPAESAPACRNPEASEDDRGSSARASVKTARVANGTSASNRCSEKGCTKSAVGAIGKCKAHGGGRRCQYPNCPKSAQGATDRCKAHGGGRRCVFPQCGKSAVGTTHYCKGHGGGRRCNFEGCVKSAQGATWQCIAHGGGRRCKREGCSKSARGSSNLCIAHGGGRRCVEKGCNRSARGPSNKCVLHGGGRRCCRPGCPESAVDRKELCLQHGGASAPVVFAAEEAVAEEDLLLELCQQPPRAAKAPARAKKTKRAQIAAPSPTFTSDASLGNALGQAPSGKRQKPAQRNARGGAAALSTGEGLTIVSSATSVANCSAAALAFHNTAYPQGVPMPLSYGQRYPRPNPWLPGSAVVHPGQQMEAPPLWAPLPTQLGQQMPRGATSAPFPFTPASTDQQAAFGMFDPAMHLAATGAPRVLPRAPYAQHLRKKQCRLQPPKSAGTTNMADGMWTFTCPVAPSNAALDSQQPGFLPSPLLTTATGAASPLPSAVLSETCDKTPPRVMPALATAVTKEHSKQANIVDADADVDIEGFDI